MALYELGDGGLVKTPVTDFESLGIRERQDLQSYLFRNIDVLGTGLKVIAQEYGSWEDAHRRLDLLALDNEGRLVVVELKRTNDGGHADLQALRYAAMISAMTFDDVVAAYADTLETSNGGMIADPKTTPRDELAAFLDAADGEQPVLSDQTRIIIVAAGFGRELTTAVLWLNRFDGMDIRCVRLRPYEIAGKTILDVEQVIPLREAAEYQVRMRRKEAVARSERTATRDWTQFVVCEGSDRTEPLRKRWAVLQLVKVVHRAGRSAEAIALAITGQRFLAVDGTLDGEELTAAFVHAYPRYAGSLGRWFLEDPIHDSGRTWVLSNQWGGENAIQTLDSLVALAPPSTAIRYEAAN